jgi:hypothetical protein
MPNDHKPLTPAEAQHTTLHPAIVEAARDDPDVLVQLSRAQLAVVQDRMVNKLLDNPEASASQYALVHERLSKNAQLEPKNGQAQQGAGFSIVINVQPPAAAPAPTTKTIDVTPTQVS